MSYAIFYDVPGDEHIYAKVKEAIGEEYPKGLHVMVVTKPEGGGLRHFAVWESEEAAIRFQEERVAPAVAQVLAGLGVTDVPPPAPVQEMDLVDVITPD